MRALEVKGEVYLLGFKNINAKVGTETHLLGNFTNT